MSVKIVHIFLPCFFIPLGKVTVVSRKCILKKNSVFKLRGSLQTEDLYFKSIKVVKGINTYIHAEELFQMKKDKRNTATKWHVEPQIGP